MTTGQFREFAGAVLRSLPDDLDPTTAQGWIENQESLARVLRETLLPDGKPAGLPAEASAQAGNIYLLSVDYGRSVEDGVRAGRYDWANSDINSRNFPTERKGVAEVVVELIHYNKTMTSEQVLADFKERGLKPAPLEVGLALGIEKPNLQREFPIVLLGSGWRSGDGRRFVPCLSGWGNDGRGLGLGCFESDWSEFYRFLAVRESMLADRQRSVGK
ncbi:MAG: hypothetical protein UY24_C0007G0001 [Parcubacteria group bacterium GW2011_GWA1_48_11b]|nr:MAG: hypothetical protein UY24_C0007G0001 [Parcubacteria group bacterium GW2011_GWA1_48_11b]